MMTFRKKYFFKVISLVLIFLFLFQADLLLSQVEKENPDSLFGMAKNDYVNGNYERAVFRLQKLATMYQNMEKQSEEEKFKYGQTLLLLGAGHENLQHPARAEMNYKSAKKLLGKNHFIQEVDLHRLEIYANVFNVKMVESKSGGRVIEKAGNKKKKKKFPWLLVIGGAVVAGALIYFFIIKKSKKYKLTANVGEGITGTPANGTYSYKKNEMVNYNYSVQSGYKDLAVTLNGNPVPSSGSIKMDRHHTLAVSATKIGRINSVSLFFRVRFAATNLEVRHRLWIDSNLKIDETLKFRVRSSDDWDDAVKIYRNIYVNGGPTSIHIQQEAGPYYDSYYSGTYWIWSTYYELEIIDYTYVDGADPGWPTLSENWFYLSVAPWHYDPNHQWYRIETKEITINPPVPASYQKRKAPKEPPKTNSSN